MFNLIVLAALGINLTTTFQSNNYRWSLFDDKYWEAVSNLPYLPPEVTVCGPNMIEVKGLMKLDPAPSPWGFLTVDELQKRACVKWIERKEPLDKCAQYDRDKWLAISNSLPTKYMHYCIDKFEYPNQANQFPLIMVNLTEAKAICQTEGKRICTEDEWTFACEGEEAKPYPYLTGYKRDDKACVIDKQWRPFDASLYHPRNTQRLANELDSLWQGEVSGSRSDCVSPFGVYDLTGNVDEVTQSTRRGSSKLALKGGYFGGRVRNRCRAATRSHDENHTFYQEGFRCCADYKEKQ